VSDPARPVVDRAERLLRWYPPRWRERYGEEFAELLIADLSERPRCWRRDADLMVSGVRARLSGVGLGSGVLYQPQAALAVVCCALVGFLGCGMSLWSQLVIGSRWSSSGGGVAVTTGVVTMSVGVTVLGIVVLLAAAPVIVEVIRAVRRGNARPLLGPALLVGIGLAVLLIGGHQLQAGWPGTGGHPWRLQRWAPGSVASWGWAETLAITTYWAHPASLLALPGSQLAWTLTSPVVLAVTLAGAVRLVRRIDLPAPVLAYEARLAEAAGVVMLGFLGAAAWWVLGSRAGTDEVFRAGSLDLVLVAGMAAALWVAAAAAPQIARATGRAGAGSTGRTAC
jgi:hypothetical protein